MTHHTRDEQAFYRDLVICFWSPRFAGQRPIETLRELLEERGDYV